MDNSLSIVMSGFESIKNHGWCNIWKGHNEEIEIIKDTLEKCGEKYSIHEFDISIQIFVTSLI